MKLLVVLVLGLATGALARQGHEGKSAGVKKFILPPEGKIIGGSETTPHGRPYQVAVESLVDGGWKLVGSGVILTPNMILSTASSIYYENMQYHMRIVAGDHDRTQVEGTEQYVNVSRFFPHPEFNAMNSLDYDFSVVRLTSNLTLSENVQPVRLADRDTEVSGTCKVSGWGALNYDYEGDDLTFPETMQEIQTTIMNFTACQDIFNQVQFPITSRYLCTQIEEDGRSPGAYDGGAPLVCQDEAGEDYVAGVTVGSLHPFGYYPFLYGSVATVRPWIDSFVIIN